MRRTERRPWYGHLPTTLVLLCICIADDIFVEAASGPVTGPVMNTDFPDPSIFWSESDKSWFAFSTSGNGKHVQMATSPDFTTWTYEQNSSVLPDLGSWAFNGSDLWAPNVLQVNNAFVLYYASIPSSVRSDPDPYTQATHCVGAATSSNLRGPYAPVSEPIACPVEQGGAIDAAGFTDFDGTNYVVYKVDGNRKGHGGAADSCNNGLEPIQGTPIMLQKMSGDGITKVGDAVQILDRDPKGGDGPLVEAPSLIKVNSTYVLFFSSGCFTAATYDVSYATAPNISGPYTKAGAPSAPLLVSGQYDGLRAPGSACASKDGTRMVFHANIGDDISKGRGMWISGLSVNGTTVSLTSPPSSGNGTSGGESNSTSSGGGGADDPRSSSSSAMNDLTVSSSFLPLLPLLLISRFTLFRI